MRSLGNSVESAKRLFRLQPRRQPTVEEVAKFEQLEKDASANLEERKELEKVMAEKMAELNGLCEQVRLPLPKLLDPGYFDG
jgi:hypothetical protein